MTIILAEACVVTSGLALWGLIRRCIWRRAEMRTSRILAEFLKRHQIETGVLL